MEVGLESKKFSEMKCLDIMKHLNKMDYSDHKQVTDPDFFLK